MLVEGIAQVLFIVFFFPVFLEEEKTARFRDEQTSHVSLQLHLSIKTKEKYS
jgi:hypothetical protein